MADRPSETAPLFTYVDVAAQSFAKQRREAQPKAK